MKVRALFLASTLLAVSTAAPAAENYRARISDRHVSDQALSADVKAEVDFGRGVAAQVLSRYSLDTDAGLNRYLNLVGSGVALKGPRPELRYRFALLDSNEVNAYAAPGGWIFVTRGALALMHDESELAAVLAHELAHVTERHIVRALGIRGEDATAGAGLARFFGGATDAARMAFSQAVDRAVAILFEDGYQRDDEFSADRVATLLVAQAGYDPGSLARFLSRVAERRGEPADTVYRTHPSFRDRLQRLDAFVREQGLDRLKQATVSDRFQEYTTTRKTR